MKWSKVLDKKISFRYLLLSLLFFILITILFGSLVRQQSLYGHRKFGKIGKIALTISTFPSLIKGAYEELFQQSKMIIPNRFPNQLGLTKLNITPSSDSGFILVSSFDKNEAQCVLNLIALKNGTTVHKWIPPLKKIIELTNIKSAFFSHSYLTSKIARINHPFLFKDGSVIFIYPGGPMVKLDSCSNIQWIINDYFHHSIELDIDGNIWAEGEIEPSTILPQDFFGEIRDDAIIKISPKGRIVLKISLARILIDNGYKGLLLGTNKLEDDPLHTNEVRPALYNSKYWKKGDLLISLRHRSTVFLYRPSSNKIIWLKTGPWLNQHCPDFVDSCRISIFSNDMVRTNKGEKMINGYNNIYIYDFAKDSTEAPYTSLMKGLRIQTLNEGRAKVLNKKDIFLDETKSGRVLRANANGIIWQYVNTFDNDNVSITSWSRYLVKDGNCKFCLTENIK